MQVRVKLPKIFGSKGQESEVQALRSSKERRRRFSPLMWIGGVVTLIVLVAGAGVFFVTRPTVASHAADVNPDCTLIVPAKPLTAQGLATPYQLVATDPDKGACHESNVAQTAFVQGAVIDPATGKISIYNPLVIDKNKKAAIAPVVPTLPANAVVALWFGSNGSTLTLKSSNNSLRDGKCVNGVDGSIFGQFSYCNAPAFFDVANTAIKAGKLVPPALGTAKDGQACPTVRDFSIVDQDQSDNVTTNYISTHNGQTAQMTAANVAKLGESHILTNGSDNRLLDVAVDGALGCTAWTAPDLADPGQTLPALPLNELQAAAHQADPVALVPAGDPMTTINGEPSLEKLNAYRAGVDQPTVDNLKMASTKTYCQSLLNIAPKRIQADAQFTKVRMSPDKAAANSLFTFLAQRFNTTWGQAGGLNCQGLLDKNSPIIVKTNANGKAVSASFNFNQDNGDTGKQDNTKQTADQNTQGTQQVQGQNNSGKKKKK